MKHAIIVEGPSFDWEKGKVAMDNVVTKDGTVNWHAAFCADPGVAQCPTCYTFFWAEADILECTECGCQWGIGG